MSSGEFEKAEALLWKAEELALTFPPGDPSLAETLDDLGQVAFRRGDPKAAAQYQGRAVAARLLAGGPEDAELPTYIARYEIALEACSIQEKEGLPKLSKTYDFARLFDPGLSPQRHVTEFTSLRKYYFEHQNHAAVRALGEGVSRSVSREGNYFTTGDAQPQETSEK